MNIKIKRIKNGILPQYETEGSSGADCFARIDEVIRLLPNERKTIPLGFAVEIPEGYEMQIRPRSGLTSHGILSQFGTIDSDYRGEVNAVIINNSNEDFMIEKYSRICQIVLAPVEKADWNEVDELSKTERGIGGFGSTGLAK